MAKVNWTKNMLSNLYSTIENGSIEEVEAFVAVTGKGTLPGPDVDKWVDGYSSNPGQAITRICCCSEKLDVLEFLLDQGLKVSTFELEDLFSPARGSGKNVIEYDAARAATLKKLVERIINGGGKIGFSWHEKWPIKIFELYPEDIDFYKLLSKAGLDFRESMYGHEAYDFAFANKYWETAEFLLKKNVKLDGGHETGESGCFTTITGGWETDAVDWIMQKGLDITQFDASASAETVVYALQNGFDIKPRYWGSDGENVWAAAIGWDRPELGDAFIAAGIPLKTVESASCNKASTLTWADKNGIPISSVAPGCNKEVLIEAAKLHIPPSEWHEWNSDTDITTVVPGCKHIGDSLEYDVIKAFLEAGISDGFDASLAVESGRQDIIELYESYGISTVQTAILDGSSYLNDGGDVVIPEGITRIASGAFKNGRIGNLILPDSLEIIETNAFGRCVIESVVVPKGVKQVGKKALAWAKTITLYDNGNLGAAVIRDIVGNYRTRTEYIVKSANTDEIKYKIWAPYRDMNYHLYPLYEDAWGDNASFDFSKIDEGYAKLKSKGDGCGGINDKLMTAINRLRWPIDLDEKTAKKYRSYVTKNALDAVELLAEKDDADRFATVMEIGAINGSSIEDAKQIASKANAVSIRKIIEKLSGSLVDKQENGSEEKPKKLTVPQAVTLVTDALDEGDASKISTLEPIADKVPMADCVELLEHAAASCGEEAIEKLFDLFAPFECLSGPLQVALFSGNVETSKALIAKGADLNGELKMIDEKRTPSSKKSAREKRYSHGLIGRTYRAGGQVACNLAEALTKYDGSILSRSKTSDHDWRGRTKKLVVNEPSNDKAADTLIAISEEKGFKKNLAIKLLWNLISFDGRKTTDACFDAVNSRKIFEAGILDASDIAKLPWSDAVSSASASWGGCSVEALKVVRDFAPEGQFAKCWRPSFAKPNSWSGEYGDLRELLLFIDVLDSDNCSNQPEVLKALTVTGNLDALKKLAKTPGWFTKQRIKKLIDASTEANQIEITAWLLELSEAEKAGQLPQPAPEISSIPVGDTKMSLNAARELFALKNIGSDKVSIKFYKGTEVNVEIPALIGKRRVVSVMDEAFYPWGENDDNSENLLKIESITLPLGMETIGERAFAGLGEQLKVVRVSATVTKIGNEAFAACTKLEKVTIPDSVTEIGEDAFCYCRGLKKVSIPERFKKNRKKIFGDDINAQIDWV